ncbi:hypothetical protein QQ045_002831 [Rhodiola kirilowii]
MFDFNQFIIQAGLMDAGFEGNPFTWCNNRLEPNRIWKRLDRVLINGQAAADFPTLSVRHLPRISSDHCPLMVSTAHTTSRHGFFHYQPAWEAHHNFEAFVRSSWEGELNPNALVKFGLKLRRLRQRLRT